MSSTCARCGAPTDATICRPEARELSDRLLVAAGHAEDAEAVLTRQVHYGNGGRGGSSDDPMPIDLTAATRFAAIENTLTTWARHAAESRNQPLAHTSRNAAQHAARYLAANIDWLRGQPEAAQAFNDLENACNALARLVDRPADNRHLVGICDCGKVLYAPWNWSTIRCKACGATWSLADGQDILLRHLDDKLVTAGEAAKLAGHLDPERSQDAVRKLVEKWAAHHRLVAHGHVMREPTEAEVRRDPEAYPVMVPTYRFGEIRKLLDETPRRNRQGAAA